MIKWNESKNILLKKVSKIEGLRLDIYWEWSGMKLINYNYNNKAAAAQPTAPTDQPTTEFFIVNGLVIA